MTNKETGVRRTEKRGTEERSQVHRFEDLDVWQASMSLAESLYKELRRCHDYSLRDQMQRSALSIASNIAEGYDRGSNKEFIRYLYIAKGSCAELRAQLYLANKIGIIDSVTFDLFLDSTKKISAMLANLIKVRKERF
jgi:four helix bundle protein